MSPSAPPPQSRQQRLAPAASARDHRSQLAHGKCTATSLAAAFPLEIPTWMRPLDAGIHRKPERAADLASASPVSAKPGGIGQRTPPPVRSHSEGPGVAATPLGGVARAGSPPCRGPRRPRSLSTRIDHLKIKAAKAATAEAPRWAQGKMETPGRFGEMETPTQLAAFLLHEHGAVLRGFRRELDVRGVGHASFADIAGFCRRLGPGYDARRLWRSFGRDVGAEGRSQPVLFRELEVQEAADLERFAEALWRVAPFDLRHAWELMSQDGQSYLSRHAFADAVRALGFEGSTALLFRGLDYEGLGRVMPADLEYVGVVCGLTLSSRSLPTSSLKFQPLLTWVGQDFADVNDFLRRIGMELESLQGPLTVRELASALERLSFPGDATLVAAQAARVGPDADGVRVSAETLRSILAAQMRPVAASTSRLASPVAAPPPRPQPAPDPSPEALATVPSPPQRAGRQRGGPHLTERPEFDSRCYNFSVRQSELCSKARSSIARLVSLVGLPVSRPLTSSCEGGKVVYAKPWRTASAADLLAAAAADAAWGAECLEAANLDPDRALVAQPYFEGDGGGGIYEHEGLESLEASGGYEEMAASAHAAARAAMQAAQAATSAADRSRRELDALRRELEAAAATPLAPKASGHQDRQRSGGLRGVGGIAKRSGSQRSSSDVSSPGRRQFTKRLQ